MVWIRSQNGELLLNAGFFEYSNRSNKHRLVANAVIVGTFPTQLAVLDEMNRIERWISAGTADVYQVTTP